MRLTVPITAGIATILLAYACGGNPTPPPPPPINQDSIDSVRAAEEARRQFVQDSIRRAREEEARIERQRAEEAARRAAEAMTARVRDALATMIHFDFDRSNIREEDMAVLDMKVRILQANPGLRIEIAGHADERGSDEYNLALGNRRAVAAMQYLVDHGIDASRISTTSYGEERPLDTASTEEAWARNRRSEFAITAGGQQLRMPN